MKGIECKQCGGAMKKATVSSGNFTGILIALIVLVAGIVVFIMIPVFGWIIGAIMVLLALGMGGKRRKVWKCTACGYIFDRA